MHIDKLPCMPSGIIRSGGLHVEPTQWWDCMLRLEVQTTSSLQCNHFLILYMYILQYTMHTKRDFSKVASGTSLTKPFSLILKVISAWRRAGGHSHPTRPGRGCRPQAGPSCTSWQSLQPLCCSFPLRSSLLVPHHRSASQAACRLQEWRGREVGPLVKEGF